MSARPPIFDLEPSTRCAASSPFLQIPGAGGTAHHSPAMRGGARANPIQPLRGHNSHASTQGWNTAPRRRVGGRLTRAVGPTVSATDTSRPVTCTVYTALGDIKEVWAGATTDTSSSTCALDGVTIKKQLSATWDDFGRKLSQTDANGATWKWTWNLHNQLVSSQTPTQAAAGQSTSYAWGRRA